MVKKILVVSAILALAAMAFAGTIPAAKSSFHITLMQPSVVNGTDLKPGDYKLNLGDGKITLVQGKISVEAPAKIETVESKFDSTAIRYTDQAGKQSVAEIRIGGSKTKIVLNQ
jgi:hypothetical protein